MKIYNRIISNQDIWVWQSPFSDIEIEKWLKSLKSRNASQEWHFDVIQTQFIDGGYERIRGAFINKHLDNFDFDSYIIKERHLINEACKFLQHFGKTPKRLIFWDID